MNDEPLIGIREAARQIGIAHSTLSRQVTRGQMRSYGGKVRLSEIIYDRKHNLDPARSGWGRSQRSRKSLAAEDAPLNGATVHSADRAEDDAHAPGEFTSETVTTYGRMLDVNEDLRGDPNIVGSVMALTGVQMIISELRGLGWRLDDPLPAANDDDPIGPRPCFAFHGAPLDRGLVRKLGRAIMSTDPIEPWIDPNDPVAVGEALLITAIDILDEETKRRRVEAGQPEIKGRDNG